MRAGRVFGIVLTSAFGGMVAGATVGLLLAVLLPNYYPSVFGGPVDPIQTGLGLGSSQGFLFGGLIGLGIAALLTWREVRLREVEAHRRDEYPRPGS